MNNEKILTIRACLMYMRMGVTYKNLINIKLVKGKSNFDLTPLTQFSHIIKMKFERVSSLDQCFGVYVVILYKCEKEGKK